MIPKSKINTEYKADDSVKDACWRFCRELNPDLPEHPYMGMRKILSPKIGCVVLFLIGGSWHSGIVWPDGMHFIHARPDYNHKHIIRQERLTSKDWKGLIEGYYVPVK